MIQRRVSRKRYINLLKTPDFGGWNEISLRVWPFSRVVELLIPVSEEECQPGIPDVHRGIVIRSFADKLRGELL